MGGESVAVEIDYVDVRCAQRIEATVCNCPCRYLTLHNARFVDPFANEFSHERVRRRTALIVVLVPACAGFLAVPAEFTKAIFGKRLTNAGYFQVAIFFADAPADIEAREVAGGQGPHGHAEAGKGLVYGFDARTFFDEELGFAAVGTKHAITDKTATVTDEHAHLAERFRKLHAGGDYFL